MQGIAKVGLAVVGLIVVGWIAWWLLKAILGVLLYLILGAVVVGGIWMVAKFSGKRLPGASRPRLPKG